MAKLVDATDLKIERRAWKRPVESRQIRRTPWALKVRGNAEPIQPAMRLAGVESGRRGPKRFRKNSHGRGAFQTPNARIRGGESRSGYENPLAARSCRFDPGSGHQITRRADL